MAEARRLDPGPSPLTVIGHDIEDDEAEGPTVVISNVVELGLEPPDPTLTVHDVTDTASLSPEDLVSIYPDVESPPSDEEVALPSPQAAANPGSAVQTAAIAGVVAFMGLVGTALIASTLLM